MTLQKDFSWGRFAGAEKWFLGRIEVLKKNNAHLRELDRKLSTLTSSRMQDGIDHLILPGTGETVDELEALGFRQIPDANVRAYEHPGALFPFILLSGDTPGPETGRPSVLSISPIFNR